MRLPHHLLLTLLATLGPLADCCIGGGGGGGSACCPAASSCAPSVPVCGSSYGSYSSYSAGGSYAAPAASYPRPLSYSAPCAASSSAGGCGGGPALPPVAIAGAPAAIGPSYVSAPISSGGGGYVQSPQYSAPLPPPPPPPPQPAPYSAPIPPPNPGPELETNYEDNNQQVNPPPSNYGDNQPPPPNPPPAPQAPYNEQNTGADYNEATASVPQASVSAPLAKPVYDGPGSTAATGAGTADYTDEQNSVAPTGDAPPPSPSGAADDATLNCEDGELRKIVEGALLQSGDNLDAARKIESEAAARFGGRFNSIVSNSEFAYVNWYGKRNCQLRVNDRHSLTWED